MFQKRKQNASMKYDYFSAYEYNDLSLFTVCYTDSCLLSYVCCFSFLRKIKETRKGNRHFLDLFSIKSSDKFTSPQKEKKKMKNWKWNRRQDAYLNIYFVLVLFMRVLWFHWLFIATHCTVVHISDSHGPAARLHYDTKYKKGIQ